MKNIWLMVMVAWLAVSAACKKDNKAEQLAALDNAYQAGVLSKGEYDAKRLALMGPPPALPAAPVTPAPVSNPLAPPQDPPSHTPPAPDPAPAPPKRTPHKPAPVVTRSEAATEQPVPSPAIPPLRTPAPPAAPPVAPPPAAPPAVQTKPLPQSSAASDAEPGPLAGCEDLEYQSGKVKGARQRFYPAPIDSVKRAAGAALGSLDFDIHKDTGNEMEASKRRHISAIVGAGGERLILHFEKARQGNQSGTVVTGETKKSLVGRIAQKSWTSAVLAQIACHLGARR